jgi:hypothetical protein
VFWNGDALCSHHTRSHCFGAEQEEGKKSDWLNMMPKNTEPKGILAFIALG